VDVRYGADRFRAHVRAESIERALRLIAGRYPGGETKVVFPIEPETFFVDGTAPAPKVVRLVALEEAVGLRSDGDKTA
jgi:hypothetical protein